MSKRRLFICAVLCVSASVLIVSCASNSSPAALASSSAKPAASAAKPLPFPVARNVQDTYFGVTVDDPYRYFETKNDSEVAAWMRAHSDAAHDTLGKIAGRDAMLKRVQELEATVSAVVSNVQREQGDVYFYQRRDVKDNQFKLYKQTGLSGAPQLLMDPNALQQQTGKPHAINYYSASPDGRYVAYGLSQGGSEDASLYVMDAQTGKTLGEPISRARFPALDWAPDSQSLMFNRLQEMKPGMTEVQRYLNATVQRVRIKGGVATLDKSDVLSTQSNGASIGEAEFPSTMTTHDGRWLIGLGINGVQRERDVYLTSYADSMNEKPAWKRIVSKADEVVGMAYFNDVLYLQSVKGASRGQVLALDLKAPDISKAKVVVPASERVITQLAAASDALYVVAREGNAKHLYQYAYGSNVALKEVKLPLLGNFGINTDERLPGALIDLQGWTAARQIYAVSADGAVSNTKLQPSGPNDAPTDIETREVLVKSHDGAMVPMSITHKRGIKLDGTNPTLLFGYASYGITQEPQFSVNRIAWWEQGGVYAVANPRGSGVFGQDWYKAGFQTTKPNTWKDFIACAEYLIAQNYTQPSKLGILGGSAGGILVGRAMTERPDLFAAVIPAVGVLDAVRAEFTSNGVPNIPEFGTVKTEQGFKALYAMSTYHHIKDGVKYPAVMFTHGANDPRVEPWMSAKAAARMMSASYHVDNARPVLLRLDYEAGHGQGSTKQQQQATTADYYSFLLWSMGQPGFALKL